MKLIIAYLPNDAFEPVRTALLDLGVQTTTISDVRSSGLQPAKTLRYRGTTVITHLKAEMRLECLVTVQQAPAVIDALRTHAIRDGVLAGRVAALDLDDLHQAAPEDEALLDAPRLKTTVY